MSKAPKDLLWTAPPHTLAKIEILERYLYLWFQILGRTHQGKDLWYIDGFAGPGEYKNHSQGSPIAALVAAEKAMSGASGNWKANKIRCLFIEEDKARLTHLEQRLKDKFPKITKQFFHGSFSDGISWLAQERINPFASRSPIFTFIDPFGAKGVPFSTVENLLTKNTSEVLINFDSDGVGRIFLAGEWANHKDNLNSIFGNTLWAESLKNFRNTEDLYRRALNLYKDRLRSLSNVDYAFAFEMRSDRNQLNYHLVFASKHPTGLEKMKEVMKAMTDSGDYVFSDAHVNQQRQFRFDDPSFHCHQLLENFNGQSVSYKEILVYVLNETPFSNPKSMLKILETNSLIDVESSNPSRRRGTFNEQQILSIKFQLMGDQNGQVDIH